MDRRKDAIDRVALLKDPTRLRLYEYVRAQAKPVGRDEAARAAAISRGLAAFHLDRLVEAGLLEAEYRRVSGRSGRGAGRPPKLYRAGRERVGVSVPETRYDIAGTVLLRSLRTVGDEGQVNDSVRRAADETGVEMGQRLSGAGRTQAGPLALAERALAELGYEPRRKAETITFGNCPFHALVQDSKDLVCTMNLSLIGGLLQGLGSSRLIAEPDPEPDPDGCCVRVRAGRR